MNSNDLLGNPLKTSRNRVCVFADEAKPDKHCKWLFIGYLLIPSLRIESAFNQLQQLRVRANYLKEIHFNQLDNHSKSPFGTKTALAKSWLQTVAQDATKTWHFHFMGINIEKLEVAAFGHDREEDTIYNRFFRSGLKYALKHSFDMPIHVDSICHDETHMELDPYFRWHTIQKFAETELNITNASSEIEFVTSDHEDARCKDRVSAEFLQMTDIVLGSFRQSFFATSGKAGKTELATTVIPLLERVTDQKRKSNPNSSFQHYRRVSAGFFPRHKLTRQQLEDEFARSLSGFYINEPLRIKRIHQTSLEL